MGRTKLIREIAALTGADKKNPQRYRDVLPKSDKPIGEPPEFWSSPEFPLPMAIQIWHEFKSHAVEGVLTEMDRSYFERFCTLMADYRSDPIGFSAAKHGALDRMTMKMGFNPADRSKLGRPPTDGEDNEFSDF